MPETNEINKQELAEWWHPRISFTLTDTMMSRAMFIQLIKAYMIERGWYWQISSLSQDGKVRAYFWSAKGDVTYRNKSEYIFDDDTLKDAVKAFVRKPSASSKKSIER